MIWTAKSAQSALPIPIHYMWMALAAKQARPTKEDRRHLLRLPNGLLDR